ncbi:hypothetical protein DAMA08_009330 [Martiniozyma asiatica (nom. inval.)]|nr:hypothetical protein DAMA08_009330 [Martiniozyma asiatica]
MGIRDKLEKLSSKKARTTQSKRTEENLGDNLNDLWETTKKACREAIVRALLRVDENKELATRLAVEYDKALSSKQGHSLKLYKSRFRKDLTAIRNADTGFAKAFVEGTMTPTEFCDLSEENLVSAKRKEQDKADKEKELRNSIGKKLEDSINEAKNQIVFTSEKWGISESAAKLDPDFD